MRTTSQSDSTCVPPVTAERSPPDSRMTGADSPVIADSSTDATPSDDFAVAGNDISGGDSTRSPRAKLRRRTRCSKRRMVVQACVSRRAIVCVRALRSVSACALPRPSAIASAKFANSTVNQSHSAICSVKPCRRRRAGDVANEHQRRAARCRQARRTSPDSAPGDADRACGTRRAIARSHDRRRRKSGACAVRHQKQPPGYPSGNARRSARVRAPGRT